MPGSITASPATGRARSRTPRRPCGRLFCSRPDHPVATSNLAAFMRISGESEAAENLLRRQLAQNPDDVGARLNLAADLLQEERAAEALALLDEGGAARRRSARRRGTGICRSRWRLLQLRRFEEAKAVLDALAALGPIPPKSRRCGTGATSCWRSARAICRARARSPPSRWRLRSMPWAPDAVPEHRIMAHYDLAKFWSGNACARPRIRALGRRPQAAGARASRFRATRIAPSSMPTSRCSTARASPPAPRAGNNDPAPVFIVGMPRSGTTLIEQILAAHRDAHGAGERVALGQASTRLAAATAPPRCARIAALDARRARRGGGRISRRTACAGAGQKAHRRQDAGQFQLSRPRRADAAGREDHLLRARSARHRPVDLHLPLSRRARLRARSCRSRLVHRRARSADGALEGRAAESDSHREAVGLGRGFRRHAGARARACRSAARPDLRPLLRKRQPRADREPRAGAPAGQCARPRPLAGLCG